MFDFKIICKDCNEEIQVSGIKVDHSGVIVSVDICENCKGSFQSVAYGRRGLK